MNIFPGIKIKEKEKEICTNILNQLPSREYWVKVDGRIYEILSSLNKERFYLFYEHPMHDYLNKLHEVNKEDLILFVDERINPDRMEGMDLFICPIDLSTVLICNHDGEVWRV